jgi:hypothetical protein
LSRPVIPLPHDSRVFSARLSIEIDAVGTGTFDSAM